MRHFKKFKNLNEYENYKNSSSFIEPNISWVEDTNVMKYSEYVPLSIQALYFEAIEPMTVTFIGNSCDYVEYSWDNETWYEWEMDNESPLIETNKKFYIRASGIEVNGNGIGEFYMTGKCNVGGNIMSLLYGEDFAGKTVIENEGNFAYLFYYNENIVNASKLLLPATTLANYCYYYMFYGCSSLTTAPELPATTLARSCYYEMFEDCTSLTKAPSILPATTLAENCYAYMFYGCTSLTTAPELPATTLADYCYDCMFWDCTSLTTAPELPATTLAEGCYNSMFARCASLTTAPELPATELVSDCYAFMFDSCTSLTTAPVLPAKTLAPFCYFHMFWACENLNEITMLATNISARECLTMWVGKRYMDDEDNEEIQGVPMNGTFYKAASMTSLPTSNSQNRFSGIPEGWEVVDVYSPLAFEAIEPMTVTFNEPMNSIPASLDETNTHSENGVIEYSLDNNTWNTWGFGIETPVINAGEKLYVKANGLSTNNGAGIGSFSCSGKCNVSGNPMSLYNYEYSDIEWELGYLFAGNTNIVDASQLDLSVMELTDTCYNHMFCNCTSLTKAPELPATTLASDCYFDMFYGCTSLTTAPVLPATTLAERCYMGMFQGCSNLNEITMLATDISAPACLHYWVKDVAEVGTFFKNADMESLEIGINGIPEGWVVEISGNSHFYVETMSEGAIQFALPIDYSFDGETWNYAEEYENIYVQEGDKVFFKREAWDTDGVNGHFYFDCACKLGGNIMSLLYADDYKEQTTIPYNRQFSSLFSWEPGVMDISKLILPATTLTEWCYSQMFYGCENLENVPSILPATELSNDCYWAMFADCYSLVDISYLKLPATTLASECYFGMFASCYSLQYVPKLPATTLANSCYYWMFLGTQLTTAPELPATTLASGCYGNMFQNCTSLTTAPELPATTLAEGCYGNMFSGCTSLTTAPELPATTLAQSCYYSMFDGCTLLTTAPELPATTLVPYCYQYMFYNCSSLTTAPSILPATTLVSGCYHYMFRNCTSLTAAPELPATTLADSCYYYMFSGCTSLTTAPELPATTLADSCYEYMFNNCSSLTTAPELPATTLAERCYYYMFYGCTSLTTAPELPATTLAERCYYYMFYGCTSLTTAPSILPATTLASNCYSSMFSGCTSLTTAPELPATTLANYCYSSMFNGCSNLNKITMLATDISASSCLSNWVKGVASTGTFIKNNDMDSLPTGYSGIPSGWAIQDNVTWTECTNLTITADDVVGNDTNTTIYYTATVNGVDNIGNPITGAVITGTAISADFGPNTSETETVERTITFEYMGMTATTTITQGVWINKIYTINLNNQWRLSSEIANPDSNLYDGVYESFSNKGTNSSAAIMYIDIEGYTDFKFYIRSYAEGNYDYVMVSQLDQTINNDTSYSNSTLVKAHTRGSQNSGTSLDSYQLVEFSGIDGALHRITIVYRKDSSQNSGADRGYILIPVEKRVVPDEDYTPDEGYDDTSVFPLYFEAIEPMTVSFSTNDIEYSLNNNTWNTLSVGVSTPSVNTGEKIYFRASGLVPMQDWDTRSMGIGTFSCTGKCNVGGNIMSMVYGDDFIDKTAFLYAFQLSKLFLDNTNIVNASQLVLPAMTATDKCYYSMFQGCTSLTTAPLILPATALQTNCYDSMFKNCTKLVTTPELPATVVGYSCYNSMFYNCSSLTASPILPAATLQGSSYANMFYGCSKLNRITMLATNISATSCLYNWVYNVASTGTFIKNPNMSSLPTGTGGIPSGWTVQNYTS